MSLPAYLFLYDENGMLIPGNCIIPGREGAIEVMNSRYGMRQGVDSHTGSMTGTRQHDPVIIHKQLDKLSPYLAVALCESKRLQKAVIKYYETVVGLGFRGIEWNYVSGNIKYDDAWMKPAPQPKKAQ